MAIAFRGSATQATIDGANIVLSLAGIAGLAENDFVIAAYASPRTVDLQFNAFMVSHGWTPLCPDLYANDTEDTNLAVFGKFMGATPDGDVTFVGSGNIADGQSAVAMAFSGVDRTRPLDAVPTTATGIDSVLADPPSITLSGASGVWTVAVGAGAHNNVAAQTFTGPTNYTTNFATVGATDSGDTTVGMGYNSSPSSPENPGAFGFSTSDNIVNSWAAVTIALRPSNPSGITFIGQVSQDAANGADITLTLPTLLENDIVIVAHAIPRLADVDMAMTTAGYTEVADLYANDVRDINLGVFYKVMGATPDTTAVTSGLGDASDGVSAVALCFRNVDPGTPMDVAATTATGISSENPDPPSIDYDDTNAIIVTVGAAGHAYSTFGFILPIRYFGVSATGNDSRDSSVAIGFSATPIISDPEDPGAFQMTHNTAGSAPTLSVDNANASVTMALRKVADTGIQFMSILVGV